jgi:hypothetical protein
MHLLALFLQNQPDQATIQKMAYAILAIFPILIAVGMAVFILPTWFICKKAGFSPWLSLLIIVPFGGIVLLYVLAFAEWKVVPMAEVGWPQQPPYPPQPPYTPQPPYPPQS